MSVMSGKKVCTLCHQLVHHLRFLAIPKHIPRSYQEPGSLTSMESRNSWSDSQSMGLRSHPPSSGT